MGNPVFIPNPVMDRMKAGEPALGMTVRMGCLYVTTLTDIGLLTVAAAQWTRGVRDALQK